MGTPALAVPVLDSLLTEHEIALVVTQPDKLAGRGHHSVAPAVKQRALELDLPVAQPERARNEEFVEQLRGIAPEAIVVVAYGQILPRTIFELAPRGCINLHYSLLPRWRGAAPVQYAVLNGDAETGVTTQWMAEKLDAGDIILQRTVSIDPNETSAELFERLTPIGSQTLLDTLRLAADGTAPRRPQDEGGVTLAPTIRKEEGEIDWAEPAQAIHNRIRAFVPWPVATCAFREGTLKLWRSAMDEAEENRVQPGEMFAVVRDRIGVATGDGIVQLVEVQAAGRPRMNAGDWARGSRLKCGDRLG